MSIDWSRILLCAAIYGALAAQVGRYSSGSIYYGEFIHWTGLHSTHLLLITLVVTPLRRLLPSARWVRWLLARRRDIGIAVFVYAIAHTVAYLIRQEGVADILSEAFAPELLTGWIALLIFLPLALTSSDLFVRKLGRRWKTLHRLTYLGAALTLLHWILTAFDPFTAYIYLAVLALLLLARLLRRGGSTEPG